MSYYNNICNAYNEAIGQVNAKTFQEVREFLGLSGTTAYYTYQSASRSCEGSEYVFECKKGKEKLIGHLIDFICYVWNKHRLPSQYNKLPVNKLKAYRRLAYLGFIDLSKYGIRRKFLHPETKRWVCYKDAQEGLKSKDHD